MTDTGARALLGSVGLMPDGPVLWARPITAKRAGLYVVELPAPLPAAPIELTRVGKWIERVPALRLDGEPPTSRALAARIASFWLPSASVLYVGSTPSSIGGRLSSLAHHVLGDRRPHADGHWLHTLRGLETARIWWAETDAPEEYLDAVLDAFAASAGAPLPERRPNALLLPWANMRRPTGERQPTGIANSVLPEDRPQQPSPGTRVVTLAPGDADGSRSEEQGTGTTRRTGTPATRPVPVRATSPAPSTSRAAGSRAAVEGRSGPAGGRAGGATGRSPRAAAHIPGSAAGPSRTPNAGRAAPEPVPMSQDALDRLRAELEELTQRRRPEVVARIKAARELGDLRENADYQAAREEQSFLEGRIGMLTERLHNAAVIAVTGSERVHLGSTVRVEPIGYGGEEASYTIVGSTEADPAAGRISSASPVGAALLGRAAGEEVEVRTPRGPVRYRVTSVD